MRAGFAAPGGRRRPADRAAARQRCAGDDSRHTGPKNGSGIDGFLIGKPSECIYILAMITWDESKRRENLRKHKMDLADLEPVFDFPMVSVEDDRERYGEQRLQSLGMWQGRVVFLVWTPRAR